MAQITSAQTRSFYLKHAEEYCRDIQKSSKALYTPGGLVYLDEWVCFSKRPKLIKGIIRSKTTHAHFYEFLFSGFNSVRLKQCFCLYYGQRLD